ncbi:hypothetical protein Y032_0305g1944 [Ancylostoma ceylanicum]|uniref:Uncharacterized protein n=1 Tax=Ancylostoma ceylanicum TaxID=53326 RepID=A0A016S364_9BILA|nr:hypothetical protein Y032_0305g1944 [Ancylostoma ceylanicum]
MPERLIQQIRRSQMSSARNFSRPSIWCSSVQSIVNSFHLFIVHLCVLGFFLEIHLQIEQYLFQLKKALNDFLEMQTQTIGSVMDEDEPAKKDSLKKSKNRAAAAGGSISVDISGSQDTTETKSSQAERTS